MAKKRKTRQEKVILRFKRELAKREKASVSPSIKSQPRQEAILKEPRSKPKKTLIKKRNDAPVLFYDSRLVKKDLLKTLILTVIALSLEFMLYLRLR